MAIRQPEGARVGSITYDRLTIDFDDRTLAHLQVVIVQRFNAGRPLLLSWLDSLEIGDGRSSVWLTPHAPMHFKFAGSRSPSIDREWVMLLSSRANSGSGLVVCDEVGALVRSQRQRREPVH